MGRVWRGGSIRRHLPGKRLIDHIVDERLLRAEQVPGGAAHEQEHHQQHSEERASHHGASCYKVGRLSAGPLTSVGCPARRKVTADSPIIENQWLGFGRPEGTEGGPWGRLYGGKITSPENGREGSPG